MEPSQEWRDFFNLVGSSKKHKEEDGRFFIELVTRSKNERGVLVVSKKWEDVANLAPKDKDSQYPEPFGSIKHPLEEKKTKGPKHIRIESMVVHGKEALMQTMPPTENKK